MITTLQFLGQIFLELSFAALCALWAYQYGYSRGERRGRKQGQVDETNWWLGIESEVNAERQSMWRKEYRR